ncbi:MAG: YlxR family protein [Christensenellaceae bacterium]
MNKDKIPIRMCVACRTSKPKAELLRMVKNHEGRLVFDKNDKAEGRGAYICADMKCLDRAYKTKILGKTMKTTIDEDMYDELKKVIMKRDK